MSNVSAISYTFDTPDFKNTSDLPYILPFEGGSTFKFTITDGILISAQVFPPAFQAIESPKVAISSLTVDRNFLQLLKRENVGLIFSPRSNILPIGSIIKKGIVCVLIDESKISLLSKFLMDRQVKDSFIFGRLKSVKRFDPFHSEVLKIEVNAPVFSIMFRNYANFYYEELLRACKDIQIFTDDLRKTDLIVYGAGSIEIELSNEMNEWSKGIKGLESILIRDYAGALKEIPWHLALNAGFSPSKILAKIEDNRKREGYPWWGVSPEKPGVFDIGSKYTSLMSVLEMERILELSYQIAELALTTIL